MLKIFQDLNNHGQFYDLVIYKLHENTC